MKSEAQISCWCHFEPLNNNKVPQKSKEITEQDIMNKTEHEVK